MPGRWDLQQIHLTWSPQVGPAKNGSNLGHTHYITRQLPIGVKNSRIKCIGQMILPFYGRDTQMENP